MKKPKDYKNKILHIKKDATVVIRDTGSLGGTSFKTMKEMYMMCTFCAYAGYGENAPMYIEGYFVEPSSIECYKFDKIEIIVSNNDIYEDEVYEESDMILNPMLGIFKPMTKEQRRNTLNDNKEWLAAQGIHLHDERIESADASGFMEMFKLTQ